MGAADYILLAVIASLAGLAAGKLHRRKKQGYCCGNCASCRGCRN